MSIEIQIPTRRPRDSPVNELDLQEYKRCAERYLRSFPSQHTFLLLRRICMDEAIPHEYKQLPLLQCLSNVCKVFMLNDLELARVGHILSTLLQKHQLPFTLDLLRFAAYRSKGEMTQKQGLILPYLLQSEDSFEIEYKQWERTYINDLRELSVRRLNTKYTEYCRPLQSDEQLINYNYYVDEILESAPTVGVTQNEAKVEEPADTIMEELPVLPTMMKLNSVFESIRDYGGDYERTDN